MFQLRLLGPPILEGPDGPLNGPVAQRHRIALLALLAAGGPAPQRRDRLMGLLWPEQDTDSARQLLNLSVHVIRQAIGRSTILTIGDTLRLDCAALCTDLAAFESALASGQPLEALRHYTGSFLQGFFVPRAPEFEQWADGIRMRLARRRSEMLRNLAQERERAGDLCQAITWWREVVTEDPGDGPAVCALMQVLAASGDRAAAILAARSHARYMSEELDADPDPAVMRLAELHRSPVVPASLRTELTPGDAPLPILAVIPFQSGERESPAGLGENIARELIVSLTGSGRFRVATSADAAGVDLVLEGTVRGDVDRLRVTAHLINAREGLHLWSTAFDHRTGARFALAEELAGTVGGEVLAWMQGGPAPLPGAELGGSELLLRGRYALGRRTADGFRTALRYFTRAVETNPNDAKAYASLAETYAVMGFYDDLPPAEAFGSARRAALQALKLAPRLAAPRATLAFVDLYHGWDLPGAEAQFCQALQFDPHMAQPHQWYGSLLVAAGRPEEAIREMEVACRLDPLSLIACAARGWACYHGGRLADALEHCDHTLELDPNFAPAHLWRGLALGELGRWDDAIASLCSARDQWNGAGHATAALVYALARGARRHEAEDLLTGLLARPGYLPSYGIAKAMLALDRPSDAMNWLERAHGERSHAMVFLRVDPQLRPLQGQRGFASLVARALARAS